MEESTLQSLENSPKEPHKTLLKLPCRNNAIPEWNNAVIDRNVLAYNQISDIIPRSLQNDSSMEGNFPPVQNQLRKWVSQPSPYNTLQLSSTSCRK